MLSICCSCRGPAADTAGMKLSGNRERPFVAGNRSPIQQAAYTEPGSAHAALPPSAYTGPMAAYAEPCPPQGPPGMETGVPLPYDAYPPWSPPGIRQPWPEDEYHPRRRRPQHAHRAWTASGGSMAWRWKTPSPTTTRSMAAASSSRATKCRSTVPAVRRGPPGGRASWPTSRAVGPNGVTKNVALDKPTHTQLVGSAKQNIQPDGRISARPPHAFLTKQGDGAISTVVGPHGFQDGFKPYENLSIIRLGQYRRLGNAAVGPRQSGGRRLDRQPGGAGDSRQARRDGRGAVRKARIGLSRRIGRAIRSCGW